MTRLNLRPSSFFQGLLAVGGFFDVVAGALQGACRDGLPQAEGIVDDQYAFPSCFLRKNPLATAVPGWPCWPACIWRCSCVV
jgi:hypothetical protein